MADLFGRYCYIDTPWIAGKRTRYRIIGSGVRSNAWCEVPVTGRTELVHHNSQEDVVFVVLDTLVSDDSIIRRFAAKDIEVIEPPADVRPVVDIDNSVDEAIRILDAINSSGRMDYGDYCELHDAICVIGR